MASTDSTATSGKVFSPPILRPNERKSKAQNVVSFHLYSIELKKQMDNHLKLLEQEILKVESEKEKGETSTKRKREIQRNGCGEWPVIIVDSDNDEPEVKHQEGGGVEEEEEESAEEDESEEDEETDGNSESDANSESETKSEKEVVVYSDEELESSGDRYDDDDDDDDDDDTGSDPAFGNQHEETSEDSSMFRMKVSD